MADNKFEFHYTAADVTAAQRLRFLHSGQLKIMFILWALGILYLSVPLVIPQLLPGATYSSWGLVLEVSLAFLVTLLVLMFVTPWLDFTFRRFWRVGLVLRFNQKELHLNVAGKTGGMRLEWNEIKRMVENQRVYVLFYGTGNHYIILPKSAFETAKGHRHPAERKFRALLEQLVVKKNGQTPSIP